MSKLIIKIFEVAVGLIPIFATIMGAIIGGGLYSAVGGFFFAVIGFVIGCIIAGFAMTVTAIHYNLEKLVNEKLASNGKVESKDIDFR
jgi:hypothetical protein